MRRLGLSGLTDVVSVHCLHLSDGRAFCLEDRVIDLGVVPSALDHAFAFDPPGPWLVGAVPWSIAEHRIYAVSAGSAESAQLNIALGSACLVVERQTWVGGCSVTHVRLTYPGDRHRLVAQFVP
jgi:GntR family histidine utilization transcriptional repressor